ncbi:hypothetical protein DLAC_01652 [Tieghemostelium lacteum]|uniref:Clu domain-containing protein n=1 Tax=Tieghemostelium lacteum TaxID=361077 RepID=A0A152A5Y3_TIELA|nr:hypothetical protein DLAC_01652 [Tieghemostelium lacteum]|eukprot:KYR01649.1 hypothetical protein DLAC_01652 [Tieghemostelium lacteum]
MDSDINLYTSAGSVPVYVQPPQQTPVNGYRYTFVGEALDQNSEVDKLSETSETSFTSKSSYNANKVIYSPDSSGNQLYFGAAINNIYSAENDEVTTVQEERAWGDNLSVSALRNIEDFEFSKEIVHWNEEFQSLLDQEDTPERFQRLSSMANDFVYCADIFGKIIISELHLPFDEKTIKPSLDLGGVAGGQKYKCRDIIFKFAADTEVTPGLWMYGGTGKADSFAQKSTNHELNGLNHVMDIYGGKGGLIRFPLIAIIDYRGYRLLALSQLPINKSTIVYGSCDGGKTVHSSVPEINKEMERIAGILNLKGHIVGLPKTTIFGPGDIEVHKGTDGRYYMLDFARMFPPEYPLIFNNKAGQKIGREIFYNMLRPELVKFYPQALSSDGFSGWQTCLFTQDELNRDITKATDYLHSQVIPKVIQKLNEIPEEDYSPAPHKAHEIIKINNLIHIAGVNFRYLGVICRDIKVPCVKEILITEIIARVWKRITRSRLRKLMDITRRPSEDPYKLIIADIFKVLLDPTQPNQDRFWSESSPGNLKYIAMEIFPRCLNDEEKKSNVDLRNLIDIKLLVIRLTQMLNIRISLSTLNQFLLTPDSRPFVQIGISDIDEVGSTIKYPYIIDFSCGSNNLRETRKIVDNPNKEIDVLEADRWVDDTKLKLNDALASIPSSYQVQLQFLRALYIKSSVIKAPNEPFRILTLLLSMVPSLDITQQKSPLLQSLVGLYHLKLASSNLFFRECSSCEKFHKELEMAKNAFEKALSQDEECLHELISNSLPTRHLYTPDLLSIDPVEPHERLVEYKTRKLYELFTLIYMLNHLQDPDSILHDVFQDYISQIQQIDNFELSEELSVINGNNNVLYGFFDRLENLKLLVLNPFNMDQVISNHISKMNSLQYLTLNGVNFNMLHNKSNTFFKSLLGNCKLVQLSINDCELDKNSFDGCFENLNSLVSLEVVNCQLPDTVLLQISKNLSNIKKLVLKQSKEFTDSTICQLLINIKSRLEILNLNDCFNLTDKIVSVLIENQPKLKNLSLALPLLTQESKNHLQKTFPVVLFISKKRRNTSSSGSKSGNIKNSYGILSFSHEYILTYKSLRS